MAALHLVTCEYPPAVGGVAEHSRVLAESAVRRGYDVHVWAPAEGQSSPAIHVRAALGDFSREALRRADAMLDEAPAPRRIAVQWVPHGYGRKGLNVGFSRWVVRRARAGDVVDLIVHEPFLDLFGGSVRQFAAALVQRYMTWSLVRAADRVWVTIPAWEKRLKVARREGQAAFHTLPVPGTIPPVRDPDGVLALRTTLLRSRSRLVGYFGAGEAYSTEALKATVARLRQENADVAVVCIGRGSDALAEIIRQSDAASQLPVTGTGVLGPASISEHLQACDALVQPYPDGVSGRRTTTVSALEHGVPVATTIGWLSEPFWRETDAVESVPADAPVRLAGALLRLLEPARNAAARAGAVALYRERFDPDRTLGAFFAAGAGPQPAGGR
jgi:glycosyltransferase involved in cell wall biosynthesis